MLKADRTFDEILKDMQDCVNNPDTEDAHGKADEILIEVALCVHLDSKERWNIVEKYREVDKWFA